MASLSKLILFSLTFLPLTSCKGSYSDSHIRYAALGDSWTSGISYGEPHDVEYDPKSKQVCQCRRATEAYAAQLLEDEDNSEWAQDRELELDFQACHGAVFDDIPSQLERLNQTYAPEFMTLTVGGNPVGFFDIVVDCVFQSDPWEDYGPEFPDPDGKCAKTLQGARERVESEWFQDGLKKSFDAILNEPGIKNNPDFRLYVISYASLFNTEEESCNTQSFGLWPWKKPKLSRALRKEVNGVIEEGRRLLAQLINRDLKDRRIVYVDIDDAFDGHRFCEPTSEDTPESQLANSWIYTLEWPACFPLSNGHLPNPSDLNGTTFGTCRSCGSFTDLGELQRPFHPKPKGHNAIKDRLKVALVEQRERIYQAHRILGMPREAGIFVICLLVFLGALGLLLSMYFFLQHRRREGQIRLPERNEEEEDEIRDESTPLP